MKLYLVISLKIPEIHIAMIFGGLCGSSSPCVDLIGVRPALGAATTAAQARRTYARPLAPLRLRRLSLHREEAVQIALSASLEDKLEAVGNAPCCSFASVLVGF